MLSREYLREHADRLPRRAEKPRRDRSTSSASSSSTPSAAARSPQVEQLEDAAQRRVAGDRHAQEEQAGRHRADRGHEARRRRDQDARRAPRADRRRAAQPRALLPERPARIRPRRSRRDAQPRRAHLGREAVLRLHAESALGPRRGARHPRLRSRREDHRRAFLDPLRRGARSSTAR